jgi:dTDP-glucose pyrophosphorylase
MPMSRSSNLNHYCIDSGKSLLDAIQVIDRGGVGIALLVDSESRLVGTLTDGDVRRAILKGANLQSRAGDFCRTNYTAVSPLLSRPEVLDIMQSRILTQIPVLDEHQRLVGLHLLHEILGVVERPHWAFILAGGRGTRLGDLTQNTPKPMLRVAGRPILERLILHFVGYGIRRIFISVHYLPETIKNHFGDGSRFGCSIEYIHEEAPLGTGGSLRLLPQRPEHPLLVCNGDLVTQVNIDQFIRHHEENNHAATVGVRSYYHQVPFGCVETSGDLIQRIVEKPVIERLINAGIYVLSPSLLDEIPERFFPITELFESLLQKKLPIGAFEILDDWIDVGHRDQLSQAREGTLS